MYNNVQRVLERTARRAAGRLRAVWVNDLRRSLSRILWPRKPAYRGRTDERVFFAAAAADSQQPAKPDVAAAAHFRRPFIVPQLPYRYPWPSAFPLDGITASHSARATHPSHLPILFSFLHCCRPPLSPFPTATPGGGGDAAVQRVRTETTVDVMRVRCVGNRPDKLFVRTSFACTGY